MTTASIEVSGPDAEALARELRAVMAGAAREGETVSAVEVDRSPELVIAVIGLVFNGVSTARTLWDWWQARRPKGVTVRILLPDGAQLNLAGINHQQLEIALSQAAQPRK